MRDVVLTYRNGEADQPNHHPVVVDTVAGTIAWMADQSNKWFVDFAASSPLNVVWERFEARSSATVCRWERVGLA